MALAAWEIVSAKAFNAARKKRQESAPGFQPLGTGFENARPTRAEKPYSDALLATGNFLGHTSGIVNGIAQQHLQVAKQHLEVAKQTLAAISKLATKGASQPGMAFEVPNF